MVVAAVLVAADGSHYGKAVFLAVESICYLTGELGKSRVLAAVLLNVYYILRAYFFKKHGIAFLCGVHRSAYDVELIPGGKKPNYSRVYNRVADGGNVVEGLGSSVLSGLPSRSVRKPTFVFISGINTAFITSSVNASRRSPITCAALKAAPKLFTMSIAEALRIANSNFSCASTMVAGTCGVLHISGWVLVGCYVEVAVSYDEFY